MAHQLRNRLVALSLLMGTVWSLPMQTGYTDTGPGHSNYRATDPAGFSIAVRRNRLVLSGHTISRQHEEALRRIAIEQYADLELQTRFLPLGVAPAWWQDATSGLLSVLVSMQLPSATLSPDVLQVRAIVRDESAARLSVQSLRDLLPGAVAIDIEFLETARETTAKDYCKRQFASLEPGPVGFKESGTELRESAFLVLDRIIALADACRDAAIAITGHTDSSGSEAWNRQLSLARANAVADYLTARGVDAERLLVAGAGSTTPIADNATRFGRGINRRIEISFAAEP